jgi:hypothetical protein
MLSDTSWRAISRPAWVRSTGDRAAPQQLAEALRCPISRIMVYRIIHHYCVTVMAIFHHITLAQKDLITICRPYECHRFIIEARGGLRNADKLHMYAEQLSTHY